MQQTKIEQGLNYYNNIISNLPSVNEMAKREEEEILFLWKGLGYYSRARNLLATAKHIVDKLDGEFPHTYDELIKLKGIGPYTAAAIASISFNEAKAVVDGNVMRVVSRLMGLKLNIGNPLMKRTQEIVNEMIPSDNPGDFNQAMMELGATICKPQQPVCNQCPINNHCKAFEQGIQSEIPYPKVSNKIKKRYFNFILLLDKNEHCFMEVRKDNDIWKGLYQFPLIETAKATSIASLMETEEAKLMLEAMDYEIVGQSKTVKHILSHQHLFAKIILLRSFDKLDGSPYNKVSILEIDKLPIPRLIEKLLTDKWIQTQVNLT